MSRELEDEDLLPQSPDEDLLVEWSPYDEFDCGMTSAGLCRKAGSEECDWKCPFSGEL